MASNNILIAIPTYNEIENIRSLTETILGLDSRHEVLIIDDNSPDGTGELMEDVSKDQPRVHVIHRERKLGLGSAYLTAFQYATQQGFYAVVQMDADYSHHPRYLKPLIHALDDHDLAIGSRYVQGGGIRNWGPTRRFVSRGGSFYARVVLGVPIRDLTGGFSAWRVSELKKLPLDHVRSEGYSFQIEMKYLAIKSRFRVVEIPIVFEDRTLGKSKMSTKVFMEAVYRVWEMKYLTR